MSWKTRRGGGKAQVSKKKPLGKTLKKRFGLEKATYEVKLQKLPIDAIYITHTLYLKTVRTRLEQLLKESDRADENDNAGVSSRINELASLLASLVSEQLDAHLDELEEIGGKKVNKNNNNNAMNALASMFGTMGVANSNDEAQTYKSLLSFSPDDDAIEYIENLEEFLETFTDGLSKFLAEKDQFASKDKMRQFSAYKKLASVLATSIQLAMASVSRQVKSASSARSSSSRSSSSGNSMNENNTMMNRRSARSSRSAKSNANDPMANLIAGLKGLSVLKQG